MIGPQQRTDRELIECKRDGCDQVVAVRFVQSGDVKPVIIGAFIDGQGRLVVPCPKCGERNRVGSLVPAV